MLNRDENKRYRNLKRKGERRVKVKRILHKHELTELRKLSFKKRKILEKIKYLLRRCLFLLTK